MSLRINTDKITRVLLDGTWYDVKPGSFETFTDGGVRLMVERFGDPPGWSIFVPVER